MKFERLFITGFGALNNIELEDLCPGLNIIEGANEAGKTTLLEFVRALFFGFAKRDKETLDARRYEPPGGGAHGGWAIMRNRHGEQIRIERSGDRTSSGSCVLEFVGQEREAVLDMVLAGADRLLYEQIFAFTLDELSSLNESVGQMEKRVYAASSGSLGGKLLTAINQTEKAADALHRKRGRTQPLNVAIANYRTLEEQLRELSEQINRYNDDRQSLEESRQQTEALREQWTKAQRDLSQARQYSAAWETWVALHSMRRELDVMPTYPAITPERVRQREELRREEAQLREKTEELAPRRENIERELAALTIDENLLAQTAAITRMKEKLALYETAERDMPRSAQKLANETQHIRDQLDQLGTDWSEERVAQIDISREPRLQVQQFETQLGEAQRLASEAAQMEGSLERQVAELRQSQERRQEELAKEFPQTPLALDDISQQSRSLGEIEDHLQRASDAAAQGDVIRATLETQQKHLSSLQETNAPKVLLPIWLVFVPVALGALALALLQNVTGLLALLIALSFSGILWWHRSQLKKEHDAAQTRQQSQSADIQQLAKNVEAHQQTAATEREKAQQIAAKLGWDISTRASLQQIRDALQQQRETRLRYENALRDIERCTDDLSQREKSLQAQIDQTLSAKSTFEQCQEEWQKWLQQRNLPQSATPPYALSLFDLIQKIREAMQRRDETAQTRETARAHQEQFAEEVQRVFENLHQPAPTDIVLAVHTLHENLEAQKAVHSKRQSLVERQEEIEEMAAVLQKRRQRHQEQFEQLLRESGAQDGEEFDRQAAIENQRRQLCEEIRQLERTLETHSAPGEARLELERALAQLDAATLQERREEAENAYHRLQNELEDAQRNQGEWTNRVHHLEQNEGQMSELLQRLEDQKTRIADLATQWVLERTTNTLLEHTRQQFESERQPAVVKRAGEFMQHITGGRYSGVVTSGNLHEVQLDEGERGRKPLWHWSRGTREQFYLALRLAFIEDYCRQDHLEPLPVVMDDVLVHSDGYARLDSACKLIAQFARDHQVLYFTCRPSDADSLFKATPDARRFRLHDGRVL